VPCYRLGFLDWDYVIHNPIKWILLKKTRVAAHSNFLQFYVHFTINMAQSKKYQMLFLKQINLGTILGNTAFRIDHHSNLHGLGGKSFQQN